MKKIALLVLWAGLLTACKMGTTTETEAPAQVSLQQQLLGTWRLVEDDPADSLQYRSMVLKEDGTFFSEVVREPHRRAYNHGRYRILTDSSMVTVHDEGPDWHASTANVYKVLMEGDRFSLQGYYVFPIGNGNLTRAVWIDEVWVRQKK